MIYMFCFATAETHLSYCASNIMGKTNCFFPIEKSQKEKDFKYLHKIRRHVANIWGLQSQR